LKEINVTRNVTASTVYTYSKTDVHMRTDRLLVASPSKSDPKHVDAA